MQQSKNKIIRILAIESSCDETAASVIEEIDGQPVVLSNIISSQIDLHAKTGGVVPEVASRAHMEAINPVIAEALLIASSKVSNYEMINEQINDQCEMNDDQYQKAIALLSDITHIAVTAGPGLVGSLLVGFNAAKTLAYTLKKPIIAVNHIEGHIYSALGGAIDHLSLPISHLNEKLSNDKLIYPELAEGMKNEKCKLINGFEFPLLALTVSGGHTSLTLMSDHGKYEQLGQTLDDAVGEAYDKVAKLLNLGYPGGPIISKLAQQFRDIDHLPLPISHLNEKLSNDKLMNNEKCKMINLNSLIIFPRPIINDGSLNFSFSGLKTAVLQKVINLRKESIADLSLSQKQEIAAAFEEAVADVLCTKTRKAIEKYQPRSVVFAGGVSANPYLVSRLEEMIVEIDSEIIFLTPERKMTGDNAAMIGIAAYYHIQNNEISSWNEIKVDSNWELVE
jgi:N6-L-threonylcarbamoyladenine synthase